MWWFWGTALDLKIFTEGNYRMSLGSIQQFDSFPNFLIVLGTGNRDVVLQ